MNIPEIIFNKIMLYNSHPVADVFKNEFYDILHRTTYYDDDSGDIFYHMWQIHRAELSNENDDGDDENDDENDDANLWD